MYVHAKKNKHLLRLGLKCRSQQHARTAIRRDLEVIKRFHSYGQQLYVNLLQKDCLHKKRVRFPWGIDWFGTQVWLPVVH